MDFSFDFGDDPAFGDSAIESPSLSSWGAPYNTPLFGDPEDHDAFGDSIPIHSTPLDSIKHAESASFNAFGDSAFESTSTSPGGHPPIQPA